MATKLPAVADGGMVSRTYHGFALDQDTGGAIRAPGGCDVYMGQGDEAGKRALQGVIFRTTLARFPTSFFFRSPSNTARGMKFRIRSHTAVKARAALPRPNFVPVPASRR